MSNPPGKPSEATELNSTSPAEDHEPVVESDASDSDKALNPKIITIWRIENAVALGAILLATTAGGLALALKTDAPKVLLFLLWLTVLGIFLSRLFWFPKREYRRWTYRLTEQILELQFGVIWEKTVQLPLSRLQHVDLHRGPLERHYDLCSLEIHTAGTRHASHRIPGLEPDIALRLRDDLVCQAQIESSEQ